MALLHIRFKYYRQSEIMVILPERTQNVRVLWLLSDTCGRGDELLRHTGLERYCEEKDLCCVLVDAYAEDYSDHGDETHADWESLVTEYLRDLLDALLRFLPEDPAGHILAGFGMGGREAVRIAAVRPDRFGRGVSLGASDASLDIMGTPAGTQQSTPMDSSIDTAMGAPVNGTHAGNARGIPVRDLWAERDRLLRRFVLSGIDV